MASLAKQKTPQPGNTFYDKLYYKYNIPSVKTPSKRFNFVFQPENATYPLSDKESIGMPIRLPHMGFMTTLRILPPYRVVTPQAFEDKIIHTITRTIYPGELVVNTPRVVFALNLLPAPFIRDIVDYVFDMTDPRINYSWIAPLQDLIISAEMKKLKPTKKAAKVLEEVPHFAEGPMSTYDRLLHKFLDEFKYGSRMRAYEIFVEINRITLIPYTAILSSISHHVPLPSHLAQDLLNFAEKFGKKPIPPKQKANPTTFNGAIKEQLDNEVQKAKKEKALKGLKGAIVTKAMATSSRTYITSIDPISSITATTTGTQWYQINEAAMNAAMDKVIDNTIFGDYGSESIKPTKHEETQDAIKEFLGIKPQEETSVKTPFANLDTLPPTPYDGPLSDFDDFELDNQY